MAAPTRIYVVKPVADGGKPRLVRATHPANALRHVADSDYSVTVATQDELVELVLAGAKVEAISAEQQELPTT